MSPSWHQMKRGVLWTLKVIAYFLSVIAILVIVAFLAMALKGGIF